MKELIKKFVPKKILGVYHRIMAIFFAWFYGQPSKKLIVIGVTGTNGKSSTVHLISELLESKGYKTGYTSTIEFKIGKKKWENTKKMGMLGRGNLQKMMRDMVKAECTYAIIETSSEGIAQSRHIGIAYDTLIFTNLTPEHIESHGGFENYKNAKLEVFKYLKKLPKKIIKGKEIKRGIAVNGNDKYANEFYSVGVANKIVYGFANEKKYLETINVEVQKLSIQKNKSLFTIDNMSFSTSLIGEFNIYNIVAAMSAVNLLGTPINDLKDSVNLLKPVPGRIEFIDEGQNFNVIVDFGYEPAGVNALYKAISRIEHRKIIHLTGSAGGGRDKARREILGNIAGTNADIVVVTNEDPYEENPRTIIEAVAEGAKKAGKILQKDLYVIDDRKKAIHFAIGLAKEGDVVLLTGKGAESMMAVKGGTIPWDEREIARKAISGGVDKV